MGVISCTAFKLYIRFVRGRAADAGLRQR